jgi:hypothetical protein
MSRQKRSNPDEVQPETCVLDSAANRLVIRFVMTKLKPATHLLRNRFRRMGARRIARNEMTDAAMTIVAIDLLQLRVLRLGLLEDGDVGVGVLPEGEEVVIGGAGPGRVA